MAFSKAIKSRVALKLAIMGASGSGKTFSALRLARGFVGPNGRVAMIDTENNSASLYADKFEFDSESIAPKVFEKGRQAFWHKDFEKAIDEAILAKYDFLIVDSASHLWEGVLDYKSRIDEGGGNSYANWNKAGTAYKSIIDKLLQAPIPVVCCFRSKTAYVLEQDENGKNKPVKIGLAPIARDGTEYEFTTMFDVDRSHLATPVKDRTELFQDAEQISESTGERLRAWLANLPGEAPKTSNIKNVENVENVDSQTTESDDDASFDPAKFVDERPSNGLECCDEVWPDDIRKRAIAFGRDPAAVEATARRKFGVGLDDLSQENLRYICDRLQPKKAVAIGR